ncbi:ATP-binding cassette domain-containing protein [Rhizosaccharibacter radicis]|uniref:ABC transporter ATP-binding protein n=1 Tax=Rhizosaccharibacter radicis TaxID=2782605 RepID=A0ABT1VZK7_9PROT|nr:ABC transporter ATP-binding protein [Acetobacteraceae bacterium KSS12]
MRSDVPVLVLEDAVPVFEASGLPPWPMRLSLMPGDCALVETRSGRDAAALADLCIGLVPLRSGAVRMLGSDWDRLDNRRTAALRARVGRVRQRGAWSDMLSAQLNILLPQLHHTDRSVGELMEAATSLARRFGLPGLPTERPDRLSEADLARAACVRALLGRPALLLLENPVAAEQPDLLPPLLDTMARMRERGCAVLCLVRDPAVWRSFERWTTHRLQLGENGLVPIDPAGDP